MARIESPFSVASTGQRLGAGQSGAYRKRETKILFDIASGVPIGGQAAAIVQKCFVNVSSARVRVGILVGVHQVFGAGLFAGDPALKLVGNLAYLQIWPGKLTPGTRQVQPTALDSSDYLFGQPVLGVPSIINPQQQGTGFYTSPNRNAVADLGATGVGVWPNFYEAQSIANIYRVEVGYGSSSINDVLTCPVFIDVDWEIMDPRDGEDTQAILSGCSLDAPGTIFVAHS